MRRATCRQGNSRPIEIGIEAIFGEPLLLQAVGVPFLFRHAIPMPRMILAMVDQFVQKHAQITRVRSVPRRHEVYRAVPRIVEAACPAIAARAGRFV